MIEVAMGLIVGLAAGVGFLLPGALVLGIVWLLVR
jgi:hypothetical protein